MRDRQSTRQSIEGIDQLGGPAHVEVEVRDDDRIALTSSTPPGEPILFTPRQPRNFGTSWVTP